MTTPGTNGGETPPVTLPAEFGNHLAGLIDGEGHFGIVRQRRPRKPDYIGCIFAMNMRDDDTAVLELLQQVTGLGSLYLSVAKNDRKHVRDAKPMSVWRIHSKAECLRLVAILEEYRLWTKKARDFAVWAKAVRYLNSSRPQGKEPMERWFREIREVRAYESPLPVEESYVIEALTLFDEEDAADV